MNNNFQLMNLVTKSSHEEVFHYLTQIQESDQLVLELITRDGREMTPLHCAIQKGDFSMVETLLRFDAPTDAKIGNRNVVEFAKDLTEQSPGVDSFKRIYALVKSRGQWQASAAKTHGVLFSKSLKAIEEVVDKVQGALGKTGVLCLGVTGEGKSSLLNYLCGTDYKKKRIKGKSVVEVVSGTEVARVGNTTISQTLLPQVIPSNRSFVWVDLPGFGDTRGTAEEICAAAGIGMITKQLKKIQSILLVVSWPSLEDARVINYRTAAHSVGAILNKNEATQKNVLLVVTKPPADLGEEDVIGRLEEIAENEKFEKGQRLIKREDMSDDMWKKHCLKLVTETLIEQKNIILADITQPEVRQEINEKLDLFNQRLKDPNEFDFSNYSRYMTQFIFIMESIIVNYNDLARSIRTHMEKINSLNNSISEIETEKLTIETSIASLKEQMTQPFTEESFNKRIAQEKKKLANNRERAISSAQALKEAEMASLISLTKLSQFEKGGERLIDTVIRGWDCQKTEDRVETVVEKIGCPRFIPGLGSVQFVDITEKKIPGIEKTVSEPINWPSSIPIQRYVDCSLGGTFEAHGFTPGATNLNGTFTSSQGAHGRVSLSIQLFGNVLDFPDIQDRVNKLELETKNAKEQLDLARQNSISEQDLYDAQDRIRELELEKISAVGNHEATKSICEMKIQFETTQLDKIQARLSEIQKRILAEENEVDDWKLQIEVNDALFSKLREVINILDLKSEVFSEFMSLSNHNTTVLRSNNNGNNNNIP